MIDEMLKERRLPELLLHKDGSPVTAETWKARRLELVDLLGEQMYGRMPVCSGATTWVESPHNDRAAAGIAWESTVRITFPTPDGTDYTFPIHLIVPKSATAETPKPAFVFISFGNILYYPAEELAESGVIVAEMVMNDIALDDPDDGFRSGAAPHFFKNGCRKPDGVGAIGMWAFGASRVLDYLLAQDYVDRERVAVVGHSRLGKTALWAGANDTRFTHVISNDSGCCGAAIIRGKIGEQYPRITGKFPHWFCENMKQNAVSIERSYETGFDQHFLLAAVAPRHVYVASAIEDDWSDPTSEYLCCCAASPAWEVNGLDGFVHHDRLPEPEETLHDGMVGYHLRYGAHAFSRHDWQRYVAFIKK